MRSAQIMRAAKIALFPVLVLVIAVCIVTLLVGCGEAETSSGAEAKGGERRTLVRNGPYYEITKDGDDFGNYFETYTVPTANGPVFCIVYSDELGMYGGGAGLSCDWGER